MGYRDDFYTVGHLIGYSGNLNDFPTAYFQNGNEYGHITQRHPSPTNVGRHEVHSDVNYVIDNYMVEGQLSLVESNSNGDFHTSRSTLTRIGAMSVGDQAILGQSIMNFQNEKYISNYLDEIFDTMDKTEIRQDRLTRQINVRVQRGTFR